MSRRSKFTIAFDKIYPEGKSRSSSAIGKYFNIKPSIIQDAFLRGKGAYKSNPSSVRPSVKSPDQWGNARKLKLVLSILKARKNGKVDMGKGQDGDLVQKALKK
jgi:hypothetical protein